MNKNILSSIKLDYFSIKKQHKLLDFGFGDGSKSLLFSFSGMDVTAADISEENIKVLKSQIKKNNIKNIHITKLNGKNTLPFRSSYFDRIIANEVLEHIQDTKTILDEFSRITKRGGIICISVPTEKSEKIFSNINNHYLKYAGHINIFRPNQLISQIKQSGFIIEHISYENFQFALFWLIQSFLRVHPTGNGYTVDKPRLNNVYWRLWGILYLFHIAGPLLLLGNAIFPKSIYIYAKKT